jgi:iron complex outermembrane recepter protein
MYESAFERCMSMGLFFSLLATAPVMADGLTDSPQITSHPVSMSISLPVDAGGSSDTPQTSGPSSVASADADRSKLDEIVVTADKRAENILDVPNSIVAISGERLESLNLSSLSDLADYVPGLTIASGGYPGTREIAIRGLSDSDGLAGPLVATYIDDLPIGSSTSTARGSAQGLDLMPYDVERIEVLEGPQGTLYGANAMAGLVKYVLKKPDLSEFEVRVGADTEYVNASDGFNRGARASVNIPIVRDELALRLSGYDQVTAGFIDNVGTGMNDANHSTVTGGRATLLWKPLENLAVQATILAQDTDSDDATAVTLDGTVTQQPLYGPQSLSTFFPESNTQKTRNYSLSVNWDFDAATLVSSSGYSRIDGDTAEDLTYPYGGYVPGHPDSLALYEIDDHISKFVEEARLTSAERERLQWMAGGYYTKEDGGEGDSFPTFTPTYQERPPTDNLLIESISGVYKEYAGFGNATFKFTDRFDVSAGARHSAYTQSNCPGSSYGVFGVGFAPCTSLPSTGVSTWMGNARFHLTETEMVYARVATGYRPGSGCPTCGNSKLGTPGVINPDRTTNYEVGYKGQYFDQRLQIALSVFYIDWKDIQLTEITSTGFGYTGNGGTASSSGFELTTAYQVTESLRLNATLAHTDAHLTQDAPGAGGRTGDQLPLSTRWSGSLTADYSRPLDGRVTLITGAGYRYRDKVNSQFPLQGGGPAPINPQNIVDLHTGVEIGSLTARLYGKNIFNDRSYTGAMFINDPQMPKFVPIQPRTIGLSADYRF